MSALSGTAHQLTLDFEPGLDDLEHYIKAHGDTTPIYYLVEKYLENDSLRKQRALAELLKCAPQFLALMKQATAE